MVSGSISLHGHGIRVDTNPEKLSVTFQAASTRVENVTSTDLTPTGYFPLPSPQRETPNLDKISIEFSGGDVTITLVELYIGANTLLTKKVSKNSSFSVDIPKNLGAQYAGEGISVSLGMRIPGRKFIDFESVTIITSGA